MAVNRTGAMFKSLTFDGEDSRDYGVYITGQAVFNAPEREVEMISIPGRNGQFALDKGRFENIEVTYPAGIFANTEAEFAEAVSNFRNLLCSKRGYVRLQDEYHPDEYRMAIYKSGLELENVALKAGEFEITFDCKPQRYLTSGEEEVTVGGSGASETVSGAIVQIDNPDGNIEVQSLSVSLVPIQSGTGNPSPDNIRPISGHDTVDVIVSPTTSALDGQTYTTTLPETIYSGTLNVITGELTVDMAMVDLGTLTWTYIGKFYAPINNAKIPATTQTIPNVICSCYSTSDYYKLVNGVVDKAIGIDTSGNAYVRDTSYNNANIFKTAMNGIQFLYELATPQTYSLTPQDIELLLGTNNVWSDGTITVTYAEDLSRIYNPTLFDAEPLLEVEGYGTIGFNGYDVEIENKAIGTVSVHNTEDNETSFSIDTTVLNSGNTFIIPANSLWVRAVYSNIDKSLLGSNGTVALTRVNTWTRQFVNEPGNVNYCKLYLDAYNTDLTFTYGTSSTIAWYIVVRLEYNGSLYNTSARCDVAYDGNSTITLTPSSSTETTWTLDSSNSSTKAGYEVLGNSTKYVSPTYIDMEIGEAYGFISSEIVSLNNVVSLPSDLPKLAPGTNTFTMDNTITQLKVVPRWWKV